MYGFQIIEDITRIECPNCQTRLVFQGGWYPKVAICNSCGHKIDVEKILKGEERICK